VSIQHADENGVRLCDSRLREPKPHVRQVGGLPRPLEVNTDGTSLIMEQPHGFVRTGGNGGHESVRDQIDDGCPVDRAVGVNVTFRCVRYSYSEPMSARSIVPWNDNVP
jgi:hypothetical protein